MWILIGLVVALLAILGFIFFDFSSGEGDSTSPNSTDSQTNQTQPTAPEAENKPQQPDTAQSTIVFPAPATAKTMPGFSSPSGNIVCFLSDDQATCKIAQNSWEGTAYQTCRGDEGVGVLSLKGEPCGGILCRPGPRAGTGACLRRVREEWADRLYLHDGRHLVLEPGQWQVLRPREGRLDDFLPR